MRFQFPGIRRFKRVVVCVEAAPKGGLLACAVSAIDQLPNVRKWHEAAALGITISDNLLSLADEVIE